MTKWETIALMVIKIVARILRVEGVTVHFKGGDETWRPGQDG